MAYILQVSGTALIRLKDMFWWWWWKELRVRLFSEVFSWDIVLARATAADLCHFHDHLTTQWLLMLYGWGILEVTTPIWIEMCRYFWMDCVHLNWVFLLKRVQTKPLDPFSVGNKHSGLYRLLVCHTCNVENMMKDDSFDLNTFFPNISAVQCLCMLHPWTLKCALVPVIRGLRSAALL